MRWGKLIANMYHEKQKRDTVDGYLLEHITTERRWGEVQEELKAKHPEFYTVEFRESLWRLIEDGKLILTRDLTIRPKGGK